MTSSIGITANAVNFMSYARSPEQRQNIASAAVFASTDYFKELPFLQGMSNVFLALQRQDASYLFSGPLGSMNLVPGIPNPLSSAMRAGERVTGPTHHKVNTPFDIYTEADVIADTDAGIIPLGPDGGYDFRRVGMAKGDLGDQAFRAIVTGYGQMVSTNILASNEDAEIEQYDSLGRRIDGGPSFEEAPMLRLFNSMSPIMLSYSSEISDVERGADRAGLAAAIDTEIIQRRRADREGAKLPSLVRQGPRGPPKRPRRAARGCAACRRQDRWPASDIHGSARAAHGAS